MREWHAHAVRALIERWPVVLVLLMLVPKLARVCVIWDSGLVVAATDCALPADALTACPTAAACPARPAALVVCGGSPNGVTSEAAAADVA